MPLYPTQPQQGTQGPQQPTGGDPQQQQSYMQWSYDRAQRQKLQNAQEGTAAQKPMAKPSQPASVNYGSPVASNGRITASPPPTDSQAQAQPQQAQPQQWAQMQNAGNVAPSPGATGANAQPQSFFNSQNPFDQNQWQQGPTSQQDRAYWQWATEQQTGNKDFWGTLQEGTVQSGSPNRVWVKSPNGDWGTMDKGAYETAQRKNGPPIPAEAQFNAGNLGNERFATYDPYQFSQQGMPTYQGAQFNVQAPGAYQQTQFTQWQGPNQQAMDQQQQQLLQSMLQNPHSMSDTNVAQLREMQKEQVTRGVQDQNQMLEQRMAATGRLGSGYQNAMGARANEQGQQQLLAGARDISLQKMQQDRQDELNAVDAASRFQTGQMGRASQGYQNTLAGQAAQAGEAQFGQNDAWRGSAFNLGQQQANADEQMRQYQSAAQARTFDFGREQAQAGQNYQGYGSQLQGQQLALERALQQQGLNLQQAQQYASNWATQQGLQQQNLSRQTQENLGQGDLNLRGRALNDAMSQFNQSHALNQQQFLAGLGQFQDQMGLQWSQLGMNNRNSLFNTLMGGGN